MYIGHTTLENFLSQVRTGQTLYLNLLEELLPGSAGIGSLHCYLLLQTAMPNGGSEETVLYWRMLIGELLAPGGIPWEHQHAAVRKAGLSAREAVKRLLQAQAKAENLQEGAVIAMPRELKLVAGRTDYLTFDKDSGTFKPTSTEAAKDALAQQASAP